MPEQKEKDKENSNKTMKNDFIELEFIGIIKGGEIFDTNIEAEAEKIGFKLENQKPFIVCIGKKMVIDGFDKALENKEIDKNYSIELSPQGSFGDRKKELIRLIPIKIFKEKEINPHPGLTLNIDNMLVKVVSVSGGRVLVDFNNPLAGKIIVYNFKIKRKIEDIKEKVGAVTDFLLKQKLDFKIEDNKIVFEAESYFKPFIKMLNDQFGDAFGMEVIFKEKIKEEKEKE